MATTVKYYYGTTLIGEGTVAPDYPVTTSVIPAGSHILKREVWVDGVLKGSDTVNVTVNASGGATMETETTAYMTELGIANDSTSYYSGTAFETTGAALWTAVDNFVKREKAGSRWSKIKYIRPAIGTTAAQQSKNLKDIATYDGTYSGDWVFDGNGRKGNGTNTYMQTGFFTTDWPSLDNAGLTAVTYGGLGYPLGGSQGLDMSSMDVRAATNWYAYFPYDANYRDQTGSIGVKTMVRDTTPQVRSYRNGIFKGSTPGSVDAGNWQVGEGAQYANNGDAISGYFNGYIGTTAAHETLTDAEAIAFQNSITQLEEDLKRKNW